MASPLVAQTPKLLDVRPDIIDRGAELFGPDGIDEKNKGKTDSRYQGLPEFARPKVDSQGEALRQPGTLLDPLNVLGLRQRTIDSIVEKGGQGLIDSYDSQTGKYSGLSNWNRTLDGVTDDDITKAILRNNNNLRQSDPEFQKDLAELKRQGVKTDSLTTNLSIQDQAETFRDVKVLQTSIREMEGGAEALKGLGDKPTKAQLESLKTELKPKQTKAIREGEVHDSNLETAESQRDNVTSQIESRTAADKINVRTADLAELTARNDMKIAEAEIDFKNNTNLYNWKTANADRDFNWRTAEADREMKKDLALLGFKDKDADRRYDREESREERRQLMLLQMLKGLQNLGGSLAI